MMEERIREEKAAQSRPKKIDKVCAREVCNMVTKGTYKSKE
jgi:hypothetical protein